MFGVILWSDEQENKAVIWCEDHGDLAFYHQTDGASRVPLDAGDWVQFDLTLDRHLRLAHNPRLIGEGLHPELADTLMGTSPARPHPDAPSQPLRGSAEIIPIEALRSQRHAAHFAARSA
jgi:hypothetical protein